MQITQAQADAFLAQDLQQAADGVARAVQVQLTPNQFGALVSFAFNLGIGALGHSTLLAKVNAGDFAGASGEFLKWDHAGGVEVAGLKRRREAERALFLKP
jgi:lysozyme